MPVEFGLTLIAPIIDEFARQYPDITVDADLSSRPADFVDENIDVSIRLGELRDPSLIVRRLGSAVWLFYASPADLARYGVPRHPKDLGKHECILQSYMARPDIWRLVSDKKSVDASVHGRFSTNNVSMTLKFAEQGHGIAAAPVYAVTTSRLVPARVRAVVDFLAHRLTVI